MGLLNFATQRIDGVVSIPADIKNQGPRATVANRADKLWNDGKDALRSIGRDVGAR